VEAALIQKERQTEELTRKRTDPFSECENAPKSVRGAIDCRMRKF
jgi:hypothetical protein